MNRLLSIITCLIVLQGIGRSTADMEWKATQYRAMDLRKTDMAAAIALLDSLLAIDNAFVHDSSLAMTHKLRGAYLTRQGLVDDGIEELDVARTLFEEMDLKVDAGDCWFNIANARLSQGDMDGAGAGYLEAIKVCTPCEDTSLVAYSYSHIGNAMYMTGDLEEAEMYLDKADSIAKDEANISFIKAVRAAIALEKGETEKAEVELRAVLEGIDPFEESQSYAVAAINLMAVLDNTAERSRLAEIVIQLLEENADAHGQLMASSELFEHFDELKDSVKADYWYYKGVESSKRLGNDLELGTLQYKRARRDLERQDYPSTLSLLEEAIPLLVGSGAYSVAEDAMSLRIRGYDAMEDTAKVERATRLLSLFQKERHLARTERIALMDEIDAQKTRGTSRSGAERDAMAQGGFDNFTIFAILIILAMALMGILLRPKKQAKHN